MEEEATIPSGTAELSVNEAVEMLNQMDDINDDSPVEHTDGNVEEPAIEEEIVETPEEQFFEINGEQVSLTDLRSGFMKNSDYTKKTQALSEERKKYTDNQRDIHSLRSEALASIDALKQHVSAQFRTMEVPDFDFLAENDPAEYVRQKAAWEKREHAVRQIYDAEQAMRVKAAEFEAEQHQITLRDSQRQFLEKYPEMRDSNKSQEVLGDVTQMLIDHGFTKDEINGVADFRIVSLLYELQKFQKQQRAIPDAIQKIEKKPVISQKTSSRKDSPKTNSAFDRFNQTRSVNDAVAYLNFL